MTFLGDPNQTTSCQHTHYTLVHRYKRYKRVRIEMKHMYIINDEYSFWCVLTNSDYAQPKPYSMIIFYIPAKKYLGVYRNQPVCSRKSRLLANIGIPRPSVSPWLVSATPSSHRNWYWWNLTQLILKKHSTNIHHMDTCLGQLTSISHLEIHGHMT